MSDGVEGGKHRHNAALQTLDLEHNNIGDTAAAAIAECLRCVIDLLLELFLYTLPTSISGRLSFF